MVCLVDGLLLWQAHRLPSYRLALFFLACSHLTSWVSSSHNHRQCLHTPNMSEWIDPASCHCPDPTDCTGKRDGFPGSNGHPRFQLMVSWSFLYGLVDARYFFLEDASWDRWSYQSLSNTTCLFSLSPHPAAAAYVASPPPWGLKSSGSFWPFNPDFN